MTDKKEDAPSDAPQPSAGPLHFPPNWIRDESLPHGSVEGFIGAEAFRSRPKDETGKP
jgi:hypothetical protein